MPFFNTIGMLINAWFRGDEADRRRIARCFGLRDPELLPHWYDFLGVLTGWDKREIKPRKWWHKFKNLAIEWARLDANRSTKVFLDLVLWLPLLVWIL